MFESAAFNSLIQDNTHFLTNKRWKGESCGAFQLSGGEFACLWSQPQGMYSEIRHKFGVEKAVWATVGECLVGVIGVNSEKLAMLLSSDSEHTKSLRSLLVKEWLSRYSLEEIVVSSEMEQTVTSLTPNAAHKPHLELHPMGWAPIPALSRENFEKSPPAPTELSIVVSDLGREWVEGDPDLESLRDINRGLCYDFAAAIWDISEKTIHTWDTPEFDDRRCGDAHAFIECDGLFFDAETPEGMKTWWKLPTFICAGLERSEEWAVLFASEDQIEEFWVEPPLRKIKRSLYK